MPRSMGRTRLRSEPYRVPKLPSLPRNVLMASHIVAIPANRNTVYEKVLSDHPKRWVFAHFGMQPTSPLRSRGQSNHAGWNCRAVRCGRSPAGSGVLQ